MTERQILEALSAIVVEALRIDPQRVTPEARLILDLGAESIDIVDIRFRIEEAFRLRIKQEELFSVLGSSLRGPEIAERFTVGSLVQLISNRLAQSSVS